MVAKGLASVEISYTFIDVVGVLIDGECMQHGFVILIISLLSLVQQGNEAEGGPDLSQWILT